MKRLQLNTFTAHPVTHPPSPNPRPNPLNIRQLLSVENPTTPILLKFFSFKKKRMKLPLPTCQKIKR